jgi:hypothetical protein
MKTKPSFRPNARYTFNPPEYALANGFCPGSKGWSDDTQFELQFGAYGCTRVRVWADHLEDAFERAVEWLDDNAPGHLVSLELGDLKEALTDVVGTGPEGETHVACDATTISQFWDILGDDDDLARVLERAEAGLTPIGHTTLNNGQYVCSWEWTGFEVAR